MKKILTVICLFMFVCVTSGCYANYDVQIIDIIPSEPGNVGVTVMNYGDGVNWHTEIYHNNSLIDTSPTYNISSGALGSVSFRNIPTDFRVCVYADNELTDYKDHSYLSEVYISSINIDVFADFYLLNSGNTGFAKIISKYSNGHSIEDIFLINADGCMYTMDKTVIFLQVYSYQGYNWVLTDEWKYSNPDVIIYCDDPQLTSGVVVKNVSTYGGYWRYKIKKFVTNTYNMPFLNNGSTAEILISEPKPYTLIIESLQDGIWVETDRKYYSGESKDPGLD